ncbi:metal ABC transporter permease [Rickettsia endosymbiont of Cardiosporidium cionae]|uniref:metal ABC transporter permease n=1 Tax=Rickettsia endosymbiont of Cardiosporidium cionae TaxID=2777155 RepID=UPI001895C96C|nr:metal ABC transporter permease [Rickettsia endosymbiont of Cardiosporidium cionae]
MLIIFFVSLFVSGIMASLGCMVLWKRYIFFADALSHASMLASAITIILDISLIYTWPFIATIFTIAIFKLKNYSDKNIASTFVSGIMVSIALLLVYRYKTNITLSSLLFGNITSANSNDLIILMLLSFVISIFYILNYKKLIITVISRDIAISKFINVNLLEITFLLLLSFAILISMKIVGSLFTTSIILIPSMIARLIATSPKSMIFISIIFALFMNCISIYISLANNINFAPIIVIISSITYIILIIFNKIKYKYNLYSTTR